ncbi:putative DD41D transposase [Trichonephila clavipes]|uniref:Putative DD41D transposase n=1 Tax=Trichonephila clavipes TaxID=2585209 RepID=A0A8X6S2Y9_TRICX|nr:putative DD41D transposase [Trichonephila clavipes]
MSDTSERMDISPSKLAQVAACDKLRDTVTGISALHMSLQEMNGRSPSPRSSFKEFYLSSPMIRKKEVLLKNPRKSSSFPKRPPDQFPPPQDPIETNNHFSDLEQDVEHPLSTDKQVITEVVTPKKTLLHPIMLKINDNFREQIKRISEKFPSLRNRIVNDVVKMFTNDHEEYRSLIHFLESDKEFEFYIIKRNINKPIKAVIKGLPSSSKIADITNDLAEIDFHIDSCTQLTSKPTKKSLPYFLVTLPRNDKNSKIFDIAKLGYLQVKVEGYLVRGITQCFNCNNFYHTAANCYMKPRCLNCQVIYSQFGLAVHQNDNQARRRFVEWAQNEIAVVPDFHKQILFRDEAHFWLNGYVNKQNCRIWSEANPQVYVETPLHPEKLTVWCALWAGGIIRPYFFKNDEGHKELWFQQDGATCHTARATIDLLKDTFGDRLISRFGPVNWPPRSCDLTPLDYFLWGYVKSLVYADKPQTLDHLEDNIRRVIADIRPQMLEKVIENWTSRLDYIRMIYYCYSQKMNCSK